MKPALVSKTILEPVSGYVEPGTLTALMGPSGCGKSTLLDMLADKKTAKYSGTIKLNGHDRGKLYNRVTAYIPQADVMPGFLTVRETVTFNFLLKNELPKYVSKEHVDDLVSGILEGFGLLSVKDTYIGTASVRGVSGGQKRRVTLARGIVALPQVIFADEPTSGLSSTDSEQCIRCLVAQARTSGVSFVVVIHQPRVEVVRLFDSLLLLTSGPGRCVYNGKMKEAVDYWADAGFPIPQFANPADFYMDMITPGAPLEQVDIFVAKYAEEVAPVIAEEVEQRMATQGRTAMDVLNLVRDTRMKFAGSLPPIKETQYAVSNRMQLRVLFYRKLHLTLRDRRQLVTQYVASVFQGIFLGLAFWQIVDQSSTSILSFFFILLQVGAMAGMSTMPALIDERIIMKFETSDSLYAEWIWISVVSLIDSLLGISSNLLFQVILWAFSGIEWSLFGDAYPWSFLEYLVFTALFYVISAVANSSASAQQTAMPFLLLFLIFNNFFVTRETAASFTEWILWLSPVAYAIEQIACSIFDEDDPILDMNGYRCSSTQTIIAVVVMLAMFVGFRVLHLICLVRLNNIQR
mmetsp:Transcript_1563/g.5423  ORF Transcript_1563/g.5423 Transcript_1563/m.5423 type:complete len:577 (-) Transcript_1563:538-2268(-)